MRSKTTSNLAIHSIVGWRERLGCCQSRRLTPLGLILMLFALFVPNIASAEIVTTSYNFDFSSSSDKNIVWSSKTESSCTFFETVGGLTNYTRFATNGTNWNLTTKAGLYNNASGGRNFLVSSLYSGDVVTFNVSTNASYGTDVTLVSTNASKSGNTFTMSEKGSLVVTIPRNAFITNITVQHDDAASYGYDPAVEIYDLYNVTGNFGTSDADFNLNGRTAKYLTNLQSGLALNNRIAVSTTSDGSTWNWAFNDHGLKAQYSWHNLSICNLIEGDRVVIQYTGQATFSSSGQNGGYNGCEAFKDVENNGDFVEGQDAYIENGMSLEAKSTGYDYNVQTNSYITYAYTVTEDGHLDIGLADGSRIFKITIYGDHQAQMVDRYNGQGQGSTSYFDETGQLEAKHHIVPGGLHVYVGNDNDTQHAEVVMSDKGPVSFVYDQDHFKMARHATWGSFNVWSELPATGTYYKFVPDVSGTMTVRLKANSINYRNYGVAGNAAVDQYGTPNEVTNTAQCPYYLMRQNGTTPQQVTMQTKGNGADLTFANQHVEAGQTYYIYGWWDDTNDAFNINNHACGVAQLIDVTFIADNYIYPLAKWVESGATVNDLADLADVHGYTDVCIKKKSDNIESVTAAIQNGKLKITNISYKEGTNPGGVVLIKVGNRWNDADPVFALTIAYDASFNSQKVGEYKDGEGVTHDLYRSEGYTWNFSDKSLNALQWNNRWGEADVVDFGTHFNNFAAAAKDDNGVPTNGTNTNSFLTYEINNGDWTFNYRVKKNGQFLDPRFLNNYDMEGDNADMMWDTQGIIINAGSTQSCIFNEFALTSDRVIDHSNKTQDDPDRYVGFLEGGSFIIPKLKKDDRVVVYMGSGKGSGNTAMELHIDNARDAMYNIIDPNDFYHAGGSMWNVPDGHNDPNYRGCYHFFAKEDGDMTFTMARGSMCKLYWIRIYRGTRYGTNGVQEAGGGYTILAEKDQSGNVTTSETKQWNLHYRGKGETIADGTGKFNEDNEVLTHSGNITNLNLVRVSGQGVQYTNEGEIGMLRVRMKCMEYNHNYVTDFADRNLTLALHETQEYPYTWDFTDVDLYSGAGAKAPTNNILGEYENYNEIEEGDQGYTWYEPKGRELSMWDADGNMILYGPYSDDQATVYTNQNMIFENSKGINGNQLYANGGVIPETKGLWFYFDNNDPGYNGSTQITEDGLRLSNTLRLKADGSYQTMGWWNTKMVVPSVPSGAAVYARVVRDPSVSVNDYSQKTGEDPVYFLFNKYQFAHMSEKIDIADGTNCRFYKVDDKSAYTASDDADEYIIAILNTGATSNLTITLNGWIVKKLSVSLDPKAVNVKGWTTESRSRVIDPELTAYLTGYDMETCLVTAFDKTKRKVTLSRVYDPTAESNDALVMRSFTQNGENGANIIHYLNDTEVKILNNGFHLFVPDMHDYLATRSDDFTNEKELTNNDIWRNLLVSQVSAGTIPNKETRTWKYTESDAGTSVECTNYAMSYKYYEVDQAGNITDPTQLEGDEAFYRIVIGGASSPANKGYLPIPTADMQVNGLYANMLTVGYEGEETGISDVTNAVNNDVFYTIDGQKLNGVPTISGIYIVNGKKVVIK